MLETVTELGESVSIKTAEAGLGVSVTEDQALLPAVIEIVSDKDGGALVAQSPRFPHNLPEKLELTRQEPDGKAYSVRRDQGNPYVLAVGNRALNNAPERWLKVTA